MHNPSSDSDSSYWNMLFYCYHSEAHKRHINSICRPSKRSQPRAAAETDERCTTGENEIGACCRALGRNDDRCSTVLFHMARLQRGVRTNTGTLWLTSPNPVGGDWSETMIVVFFLFVCLAMLSSVSDFEHCFNSVMEKSHGCVHSVHIV